MLTTLLIVGTTTEEHDQSMHGMLRHPDTLTLTLKLHPDRYFVEKGKERFSGLVCGQRMIQVVS